MEQDKQQMKELKARIKYELAMELRHYLVDNTDECLYWTDTKTHLVELVMYLSDTKTMVGDDDLPMPMMYIVRMACSRFHLDSPRNLSTYKANISKIQGDRSNTLLNRAVLRFEHNKTKLSVRQFVTDKKSTQDIHKTHQRHTKRHI